MTGHVNDHKLAALQSLLSISGGNIDDLEQAWLISEASNFGNPNDMWLQVFQDNGASASQFNTAASEFLIAAGFSGDINQMWHDYWEAGGGTGAVALVFDTFTDTDSTALPSHTPDIDAIGGGWLGIGGNSILNNKAKVDVSQLGITDQAVIETSASEVKISMDIVNGSTTAGGCYALCRSEGYNGSVWIIGYAPFLTASAIYQWDAGFTLRGSTGLSVGVGQTIALEIVTSGTTLTSTIDGGSSVSYGAASMNLLEKHHGLWSEEDVHRMDNFKVEAIP